MKSENVIAYIFALLILLLPAGYLLLMRALDVHGLEFSPKYLLIFAIIAVLVAFTPRITKLLDGKKLKLPFGIEVEDKQDGE